MNGTLSGIIAILMWSFMASLIIFSGQTSPLTLTALSLFIGAITLLGFHGIRGESFNKLKSISFYDYLFVTCGVCLYTSFVYISFKISDPVEANILNYLWPVLLGIFSGIRHKKPIAFYEFLGLIVSFLGVFLIFYGKDQKSFFDEINLGHIFAISAAFIWAGYSTFAKERQYSQTIMIPVFLLSALACLIVELILSTPVLPKGMEWLAVFVLGVFRISYAFWDYGMKNGNVLILSSLSYATPLLSFLVLISFGFNTNSQFIFLSVLLVTAGCFLTNYNSLKKWVSKK